MKYAVFDVLSRAFVTDDDGEWLFDSRDEADALRQAEHEDKPGTYLITTHDADPPSAEAAIERLQFPDGPVTSDAGSNAGGDD